MTTFYTLGARLSGMAAVVCAVLALLAYPGRAQAEDYETCKAACEAAGFTGSDLMICTYQCQQGSGTPKCTNTNCDNNCAGKYPNCGGSNSGCNKFTTNECVLCKCVSNKAVNPDCACQ